MYCFLANVGWDVLQRNLIMKMTQMGLLKTGTENHSSFLIRVRSVLNLYFERLLGIDLKLHQKNLLLMTVEILNNLKTQAFDYMGFNVLIIYHLNAAKCVFILFEFFL